MPDRDATAEGNMGCYYVRATVLKKNLASAKIVKIEFNANLDLLGFPHFITFKECRKVS